MIVDDYKGAYELVCHLIERGYKRIAHLAGPENISIGRNRMNGYRDALIDHGIAIEEKYIVTGGFRQEDGTSGIEKLLQLDTPPDAVFSVNDPVALGAFIVLREKKLRIPEDIALAGFSNNPLSSIIEPPLTTVDQAAYEIGRSSARLLLNQIEAGAVNQKPEIIVHETKLIIRKST